MADQSRRAHTIKLRVSDDELDALRQRCTQNALAPWIRQVALGENPIRRSFPMTDPALRRQLIAISNNLNQIARKINSGEWSAGEQIEIMSALNNIERGVYSVAYGRDDDDVR